MEQSLIHDLNWISADDRLFIYVVAQQVTDYTLACFQLSEGEPKLRLISEEFFHHALWLIPDLPPWGSVFVTITYENYGSNPTGFLGNEEIEFITLTNKGFFKTHFINLNDLMTKDELDSIRSSEELQNVVTFKLLASSDWQVALQEGYPWLGHPPQKLTNIDGTTYYSAHHTGDSWKEIPLE